MIDRTEHDLFVLALILILVAYFVGASTDLATLGQVIVRIFNVATGRPAEGGGFAAYPKAA